VITDPFFYMVAIPAVLMLGLSKSGFLSGFGSLAVPIVALAVSVPEAAAILLPCLCLMDLVGQGLMWRSIDRPLIRFLLPFGLLGTVVGTLLFKAVDAKLVAGITGVFTLGFLALRLLFKPGQDAKPLPKWLGGVLTTTAGFTSFVSHAGGPPLYPYVLPLRLAPLAFSATMGAFFMVINLSKWLPYAALGLIDWRNISTSLVLLPLAPVGVVVGVWLNKRIKTESFYMLLNIGMGLTGLKLLWDGFGPR
jgi:uncharacterized protein